MPCHQVHSWPVGNSSKAAALHVGPNKVTAASRAIEQLQRKLYALQQQLDIERNKADEAHAEAEHYRSLYYHAMSNLQ